MKTSTVTPSFYYVFNISLYCNDTILSFIGNLWRVLLLGNHLKAGFHMITDHRRSQKVLRSPKIIWKHTSAIVYDPAIVIAEDVLSSAVVCDQLRLSDHPGKHQRSKQRCQDLYWKVHNHANFCFALIHYA